MRANLVLDDALGQSASINAKMTPLLAFHARFQSKPAEMNRTDEASKFGNHVIGYKPSLQKRYTSYDQLAENNQMHIATKTCFPS